MRTSRARHFGLHTAASAAMLALFCVIAVLAWPTAGAAFWLACVGAAAALTLTAQGIFLAVRARKAGREEQEKEAAILHMLGGSQNAPAGAFLEEAAFLLAQRRQEEATQRRETAGMVAGCARRVTGALAKLQKAEESPAGAQAVIGEQCVQIASALKGLADYFGCTQGAAGPLTELELPRVVSEAVVRNEKLLREKKIGLRRAVCGGKIQSDEALLGMALDRVLQNAIRNSPLNGTVGILCREAEGMLRLSVEDAGEGIPAGEIPRLFEKEGEDAAGLLAVKAYLELLGHGLEVHAQEGRGTRVTLVFRKCQPTEKGEE